MSSLFSMTLNTFSHWLTGAELLSWACCWVQYLSNSKCIYNTAFKALNWIVMHVNCRTYIERVKTEIRQTAIKEYEAKIDELNRRWALCIQAGAFLAAVVWGGHIFIWGRPRISDDLMHDWVNGVIWHQLCDVTLWIQLLCNPATLQPVSLGGHRGGQSSHRGACPPLATPKNRLCKRDQRMRKLSSIVSRAISNNSAANLSSNISDVRINRGGLLCGKIVVGTRKRLTDVSP